MADYAVEIDLDHHDNHDTQVVELVGADRTVLDVGCSTGDVGRALVKAGCTVWGVERDARAAELASGDLTEVRVADLDVTPLRELWGDQRFDAVVVGDLLGHLADPVAALRDAGALLAPGGRVVVSLPNVTHGSVRLALLQGRWSDTDSGLPDGAPVRLFSREGVLALARDAGLVVDRLQGTLADPLDGEVQVDDARLPGSVVEWVRDQPDALVRQFVLRLRPPETGEVPSVDVPLLVEPSRAADVRRRDAHTERRAAELAAARRDLTVRDHIIGLEAAASSADARARRLRQRVTELKTRDQRTTRQLRQLQTRVAELESTSARTTIARAVRRRLLGRR